MRLALANLITAAFMCGVIWLMQLLVYPMFLDAGPGAFPAWESEHSRRITLVVGPAILVQIGLALALVSRPAPDAGARRLAGANLLALLVAVTVTGLVSVPLHDELSRRLLREHHRRARADELDPHRGLEPAAPTGSGARLEGI